MDKHFTLLTLLLCILAISAIIPVPKQATAYQKQFMDSKISLPRPLQKYIGKGGKGGAEFDDLHSFRSANIVSIHSLSISAGDYIDSIGVVYLLANKSLLHTPERGLSSKPPVNISLAEEGFMTTKIEAETDGSLITRLTITALGPSYVHKVYGPFGKGGTQSFTVEGQIIALNGRSGDSLDNIGVYKLASLTRSDQYGPDLATDFDDYADLQYPPIVRIQSIKVWNSVLIEAFQVEYLLIDGRTLVGETHGFRYGTNLTTIVFDKDENIVTLKGKLEINLQTAQKYIGQLSFVTSKANGKLKEYGPFGVWGRDSDSFSVHGKILSFHGGSGALLYRIGAYFL